jgi:hypothetical protein
MHHAGVTGYDRTPGRLSLTRAPSLRAISDPVDDLRFRRGHHFDACVGSAPTRSGDLPATRWAAHQRTQNLYQTFPEYPLLFEKAVICLFSHGPVAWPFLGRRCWCPYRHPVDTASEPARQAISRHVPAGNPWVVSVRVRRALRPIRWGVGWSPVPGHAGH